MSRKMAGHGRMRAAVLAALILVPGATAALAGPAPGSAAAHHDGLVLPVAVFGKDERSDLPPRLAALKSRIGLFFNNEIRTVCTAFCVAENLIVTAAHCIFRTEEEQAGSLPGYWFATDIEDERTYSRIAGAASGSAAQSIMAGATRLRIRPPIDASSDWAAVRLATPVCRAGGLAIETLDEDRLERAAAGGRVFGVAYHRDFKEWSLAYSPACEIAREFDGLKRASVEKDFDRVEGLVLHTCDTGEASSGSPLLVDGEKGPVVVGVNVGTYVQSRVVYRDGQPVKRSKPQTLANTGIAAAAFAGPLARFRGSIVATAPSDIAEFQRRLRRLNLYAGAPDGTFGELTRAAIKAYERGLGLPETGMPTAEIARRLLNAPPLPERKPHGPVAGGILAGIGG